MRTNLYFVRHAHSIYTPEELTRPLSEKGKADALRVTSILANEKIDVVISSPYKRAIQTVEGVADYIYQNVIIIDDFKERKLSEGPVADFESAIRKVWEDERFSWAGGESNLIAQKRGVEATHSVLETHEGKNIVIGTHGNLMVLIMNYFDKKYDFSFWSELDMPDIYKLTFENGILVEVNRIWQG
ncbi:histidine phosphatase family protein [Bacillus sp. HNG]|uniref:histidine phosphatase family protein n=1 Tax=Bacillus sp. HNG TaxID=2293325 RepID=UPI000E2ECA26|nr:histidine phosphatase family protein [Bacillus sp. HNG]RFB14753.1 histidine phosphatase family protein [Bacillus sp. HNG]